MTDFSTSTGSAGQDMLESLALVNWAERITHHGPGLLRLTANSSALPVCCCEISGKLLSFCEPVSSSIKLGIPKAPTS